MNEEPPSIEAELQKTSVQKKIEKKIKEIYQRFSYKPKNKSEIVETIRDSSDSGVLEKATLSMMEGALKVSTSRVRDIMVHRPQITFVDSDESAKDFIPRIIKSGHSRFPVLSKESDEVIGILMAKDLLGLLEEAGEQKKGDLNSLLRPVVLIPESKKLDTLLEEFKSSRNHMAVVVDEYGGVTGLVTIEDVLEEIVGEIEDEYDEEQIDFIKPISKNEYLVSALTPIEDFNKELDCDLEHNKFDTIGGVVMHSFSRLPKLNDSTTISNIKFIVTSTGNKRIKRLKAIKNL
tara:strand:+ start:75 stop:947 length:873 start_codon:yes stop_codon:yes gene_type:complete